MNIIKISNNDIHYFEKKEINFSKDKCKVIKNNKYHIAKNNKQLIENFYNNYPFIKNFKNFKYNNLFCIAGGSLVNASKCIKNSKDDLDFFIINKGYDVDFVKVFDEFIIYIKKIILSEKYNYDNIYITKDNDIIMEYKLSEIDNANLNNDNLEIYKKLYNINFPSFDRIKQFKKNKNVITINLKDNSTFYQSSNCINLTIESYKIQIINFIIFDSIHDLFQNFDSHMCRIAYDFNNLYFTNQFQNILETNYIILEPSYKVASYLRYIKYCINKNFFLILEDYDKFDKINKMLNIVCKKIGENCFRICNDSIINITNNYDYLFS